VVLHAVQRDAETHRDLLLRQAEKDGRQKLPELVPPNSVVGQVDPAVAEEVGLDVHTLVVSGTNDTQAAAIATRSSGLSSPLAEPTEHLRLQIDSQMICVRRPAATFWDYDDV
jgi:ribulose kinase